ncbi:alpha/beta hydrolase [Chryseobacterium sp.]|jgi:predicted alpha/beta hydrolase family esterase|uniref:RBBP9/YdeN family alpha/beta hydrolase n=1 Tax=Chryseobacterium sp. TaxID=1871047 RepID=UPI00284FC77D|nr:alpha/beta hydrolase [Chryseobacterium sp.]MDR3023497.1 alpha/beta hydrolase [Chryseobacterium sp.]
MKKMIIVFSLSFFAFTPCNENKTKTKKIVTKMTDKKETTFRSKILILPGLWNSGEKHWQTMWERSNPEFTRVIQQDWENPECRDWVEALDKKVVESGIENVILVGHSLACPTIAFWAHKYNRKIKGALLVAPVDTEADTFPSEPKGFSPIPMNKLPFRSIIVASSNDPYATLERSKLFAKNWGSEFINIGEAGHISSASGLGSWNYGLEILKKLDK